MNEEIQINRNAQNLMNNVSYTSNDNMNNTQNNCNNSINTQTAQYYNKKKNPRDMSIEELEEYIQKNRAKSKNVRNFESHSLNSSFTCNNNFQFFEKVDNKIKNDNLYSVKRNQNTKQFMMNNEDNNLKLNINNSLFNNNDNTFIGNISNQFNFDSSNINNNINNHSFKNNSLQIENIFNKENNIFKENNSNLNIYNNNNDISNENSDKSNNNKTIPSSNININMNIPSPCFKSIHNTLNYTLNNDTDNVNELIINNSANIESKNKNFSENINNEKLNDFNPNSNANYIKLLENKIEKLNLENQNLQKIINQNNNEEKFNKILKEIELYKNKILQLEQEKITFLNELENCKKFYEKNISELKKKKIKKWRKW